MFRRKRFQKLTYPGKVSCVASDAGVQTPSVPRSISVTLLSGRSSPLVASAEPVNRAPPRTVVALAELAPGVSIDQARDELKTISAQFAADAATRFPYPADAPKGGDAQARAQVGYSLNKLEIANLSNEEWRDVEVWVNGTHVVFVPTMQPPNNGQPRLKTLHFQMIFDDKGNYFPLSNKEVLVTKVEIFREGKLYDVPVGQAD